MKRRGEDSGEKGKGNEERIVVRAFQEKRELSTERQR